MCLSSFHKLERLVKVIIETRLILMMWHVVSILTSLYLQVRDVKLIMDRNSRRSKGVGYVVLVLIFFNFYTINFAMF